MTSRSALTSYNRKDAPGAWFHDHAAGAVCQRPADYQSNHSHRRTLGSHLGCIARADNACRFSPSFCFAASFLGSRKRLAVLRCGSLSRSGFCVDEEFPSSGPKRGADTRRHRVQQRRLRQPGGRRNRNLSRHLILVPSHRASQDGALAVPRALERDRLRRCPQLRAQNASTALNKRQHSAFTRYSVVVVRPQARGWCTRLDAAVTAVSSAGAPVWEPASVCV